jgi:uncharacterized lipoprotein YehR (DUF1307 family)
MKKLLVVGLSALVLAACGDTEVSEKEVGNVETTESVTNEEGSTGERGRHYRCK